jgi:hypothetical protein
MKRKTYFVAIAIVKGELQSHVIENSSSEDASLFFKDQYGELPSKIYGPFFKKAMVDTVVGAQNNSMAFNGKSENKIYNGWNVTALYLNSPPNCAYLLFKDRIDKKVMQKPGCVIVNVTELQ